MTYCIKRREPFRRRAPLDSSYRFSFISEYLRNSAGSDNQDDDGDDQYCTDCNDSPEQVGRNDRCGRGGCTTIDDRYGRGRDWLRRDNDSRDRRISCSGGRRNGCRFSGEEISSPITL